VDDRAAHAALVERGMSAVDAKRPDNGRRSYDRDCAATAAASWPHADTASRGDRIMSTRRKSLEILLLTAALVGSPMLVRAAAGFGGPMRLRPGPRSTTGYEEGSKLFFNETFLGNGRTCATCHDPRNEFTVSPELAQRRHDLDPNDPLFRAIDSDDGDGLAYTKVLTRAVFRVTIPLHPNVVLLDAPERRTITVWRGVPSVNNVNLTAPYLADGRAATLPIQERGAIHDHMEPGRKPLGRELDAIETFLIELYYPQRLRALANETDPLPMPPGFTIPVESPAALRGKASFALHCRRCHGGELGHLPAYPASPFADVFVSDENAPGFPWLHLGLKQPDGSIVESYTPDPGRAAITGDLADLNAFDTPSLRGLKHTAPYFHDNSALTLRDVVDHYNNAFQFQITPQEADDLIAYLELL
jgi:cytochrome c peroxidase